MKIKKFQLLSWKERRPVADLSGEEIVAVGKSAFARHKRLESALLPTSLTTVKAGAFKKCRRLKTVALSDEWNTGISDEVFSECVRLSDVEPFTRICSIGRRAFYRCHKLPSPVFGADLRKIGEEAFRDCVSIERVTLPSSLGTMGRGAFAGCTELAEVTMEEGLSTLAPRAFFGCISLCDLAFPTTVKAIPARCFGDCSALTTLQLPQGVETVGSSAFRGCTALETVELGYGLTSIGRCAFGDTPQLKSITVPSTLKHLGFAAFGLGKTEEKAVMYVENEYMLRRMRRCLFLCGSSGRVRVALSGMTIEERKRGRRRATLEQTPVHIFDEQTEVTQNDSSEQIPD